MEKLSLLILGAGPSGLTLAHSLINQGVPREKIRVIEKESVAGGLCRSEQVDGSPLDIGGGHFLDARNKEVLDFLFKFMPQEEWDTYNRIAKIHLRGQEIDHPLESNLWQLTKEDQIDYLESIAQTGSVSGKSMPDSFTDWVYWKFGDRIAQDYMLPYNRKIWSMDLNRLGTYWLYKLPDVSFRDTLRSCLEGRPFGSLPAHGTFLYPKNFGYGEVWRRMGVALDNSLITHTPVLSIDLATQTVNNRWQAEYIINTIPWHVWSKVADVPDSINKQIAKLHYVSVDVDYHSENVFTSAHWIYEPKEDIPYHRRLIRHNFCPGSCGYWTETNATRSLATEGFRYHNQYSYPVNTIYKPDTIVQILAWAKNNNIIGAGRWGMWEHMNSDVAVAEAIKLSQSLAPGLL